MARSIFMTNFISKLLLTEYLQITVHHRLHQINFRFVVLI